MADRPWVTPADVLAYTASPKIKDREENLALDIARAECSVISYTSNSFDTCETIPEPVRLAVLLLAQHYALTAMDSTQTAYKSETFDDYAYTLSDAKDAPPEVRALLAPFVLGSTRVRLRKL